MTPLTKTRNKTINILLVEDSLSDARLTIEAFRDGKLKSQVHHVINGEEATAFLRKTDSHCEAPRPDLILLDLNIPRKNGHEFLEEIKTDEDLRAIPVVVLTTSQDERDVHRCYEQNANCYITKPVDLERFVEVIGFIERFFFEIVTLPQS